MNVLYLILLVGALVFFVADALHVASPKFKLISAGLALWVLVGVIQLARIV